MLRAPRSPLLLVICFATCSGCASTGENRFVSVSPVAAGDKRPQISDLLRGRTTISPSRPSKAATERTSDRVDEKSGSGGVVTRLRRPGGATPSRSSESDVTEELIESELRDAPVDERDGLRRELWGLDSDLVRQILRIRRRGLDEQQRQVAQSRNRQTKPIIEPGDPPVVSRHTPPKLTMPTLSGLGITNPFSLTRPKVLEGHTPPAVDVRDGRSTAGSEVATASAADSDENAIQRANFTPPVTPPAGSEMRNGEASPAATDPSEPTITPASVSAPAANATWKSTLEKLITVAEVEVSQLKLGPSDIERQCYSEGHVYLRLLYLMAGRPQQALQVIPGLEPVEQEFWQQMLWGIAGYFDSQAHPAAADRATHTISQLATAIQRLQQQANLELRNVTLCHKISGFGNYERFAKDEFSPGQPVLIYAEIANFRSEVTPEGLSRTLLISTVEIVKPGETEEVLEKIPFPVTEDLCRSQRRDYFHSYEITLPKRLTSGPHVLRLTVEDQFSKKSSTTTLNFAVK
ncbi:MAG: hypothetical protein HZA46_08565 [Planctomycetales bacterium]|nr:hypothetical protein [Planctomycetales bacterium]